MLPTDNFDVEAVKQLQQAPAADVLPMLPQMLTWVQDMNWPVAEPMLEVLLQYATEITPLIEDVLLGKDDEWIVNCLVHIVPKLPFFSKLVLANAVEQLATQSVTVHNEHVVDAAKQALQSMTPY